MNHLEPRDTRVLNALGAGNTNEGRDIVQAYVDGILQTEKEWADAKDQQQAYIFTESATRQDVLDIDSMVDGGRMALTSVARGETNDEHAPKPKMSIGDTFYSKGQEWEVVREPFWNYSDEGDQWWYPSRLVGGQNIKESSVDDLAEEDGAAFGRERLGSDEVVDPR